MNFIFLTTLLILLFSLVSTSMSNSLKTTAAISIALQTKTENVLKLQNTKVDKDFAKLKKKSAASKKNPAHNEKLRKAKRKNLPFNPRQSISENSKLNLFPLTSDKYSQIQKNILSKTLKNLLNELYKDEPIFKRELDISSSFLDTFAKEITDGIAKTKSLSKIPFSNTHFRNLYTSLCNGSYKSIDKAKPLVQYLTLQNCNNKAPLCFPSLSLPVLKAFLEKISIQVLIEEEKLFYAGKKNYKLAKKDLDKVLDSALLNDHKKLLSFQNQSFNKEQTYLMSDQGNLIISGPPA
ncbi:MAG: hypothetical protein S4CHLAM20_12680 [Chlamydiia bacterium]|nr:hypothetical protein [Chlamydiia bacterium]